MDSYTGGRKGFLVPFRLGKMPTHQRVLLVRLPDGIAELLGIASVKLRQLLLKLRTG